MSMGWTVVWITLGLVAGGMRVPQPAAWDVGPVEERSIGQELQEIAAQGAALEQSV